MSGVLSKPKRRRIGVETDEEFNGTGNCSRKEGAEFAFSIGIIVATICKYLDNTDLRNVRGINEVFTEEAEKLLEQRILTKWITFPLYGCQQWQLLKGIPVMKVPSTKSGRISKSFNLKAYFPVGMRAGTNSIPGSSMQIFGEHQSIVKNIPEKCCTYKKQAELVSKILSNLGHNLTSLAVHNIMLYPSNLVDLLKSTPNLKALDLSFLTLKRDVDPDFEKNLVPPPLGQLSSLKLQWNTDTGTKEMMNFWLVKEYASQLVDLELDARRFAWHNFRKDDMDRTSLYFWNLQRLRVSRPSLLFILMAHAPILKLLSIELKRNLQEYISFKQAFAFASNFAASLTTLQMKVPWDFTPIYENVGKLQLLPIGDFKCLTKLVVTNPHNHKNTDQRAAEACKIILSKLPCLKELRLLHQVVSVGTQTEEQQNEYRKKILGFAKAERYWESSSTLEQIWIELEILKGFITGKPGPPIFFCQDLVWDKKAWWTKKPADHSEK